MSEESVRCGFYLGFVATWEGRSSCDQREVDRSESAVWWLYAGCMVVVPREDALEISAPAKHSRTKIRKSGRKIMK